MTRKTGYKIRQKSNCVSLKQYVQSTKPLQNFSPSSPKVERKNKWLSNSRFSFKGKKLIRSIWLRSLKALSWFKSPGKVNIWCYLDRLQPWGKVNKTQWNEAAIGTTRASTRLLHHQPTRQVLHMRWNQQLKLKNSVGVKKEIIKRTVSLLVYIKLPFFWEMYNSNFLLLDPNTYTEPTS